MSSEDMKSAKEEKHMLRWHRQAFWCMQLAAVGFVWEVGERGNEKQPATIFNGTSVPPLRELRVASACPLGPAATVLYAQLQ